MSKKARKVRGTLVTKLVMCEGVTDKRFIERVKCIYHKRGNGITVRIDEAGGGGPKSAIMAAITHEGQFDRKYVFIDSDLPISKDALAAANRKGIIIIQSAPLCLEGLMLRILGNKSEIFNSPMAKDTLNGMFQLSNGITQLWYDTYINAELLTGVAEDEDHCSCNIVKSLLSIFVL